MSITQRAIEVLHTNIVGGQENYSFNLHLDFTPTHVIVRSINYERSQAPVTTKLHQISAPWTNHHPIGVFLDDGSYISNPHSIIPLGEAGGALINGQITIIINRIVTDVLAPTAVGVLSLTLEFYREEEEKEDALLSNMSELINVLKTPKNDIYPFNPLPSQYGGYHSCMCGGASFTGDTRNALDQINPIPDVNVGNARNVILEETAEEQQRKQQEEKKEEGKE